MSILPISPRVFDDVRCPNQIAPSGPLVSPYENVDSSSGWGTASSVISPPE